MTGNCRVGLAKVLMELDERDKAREQLAAALEYARLIGSRTMEVHCFLTMAELLLKEVKVDEANQSLREGLQVARDLDYLTLDYWWRPTVMANLLAHALEAGIEVDFVKNVIRRRGLCAPSSALKHWPYPARIATLGRFEIAIDDNPLTYSGKTQRKPLELLQYLCAADRKVSIRMSLRKPYGRTRMAKLPNRLFEPRCTDFGVYQRFSRALHTKLGVPPTPETVSLYHTITKPQSVE